MIRQISIKTQFGWISAFEEKNKIVSVIFGKYQNRLVSKNLKKFKANLDNFLKRKTKLIKSDFLIRGSIKQKKVWRELRKIKFGETKTYGEIAKKLKLSPRYIGKICGQNKIVLAIPCHRVIGSGGNLGGFSGPGGVKLKKKLLDFEKS